MCKAPAVSAPEVHQFGSLYTPFGCEYISLKSPGAAGVRLHLSAEEAANKRRCSRKGYYISILFSVQIYTLKALKSFENTDSPLVIFYLKLRQQLSIEDAELKLLHGHTLWKKKIRWSSQGSWCQIRSYSYLVR